jgi:N-acetylglucosaminyldiphosphoundecaprenol N-acetyl-beta-D-mannosaminyltransferase
VDTENTPLVERINLLNVPIDIVPRENLETVIAGLLERGEGADIVLLSVWDLLRARRNSVYRRYVENAALVIPISKSIVSGARFLSAKTPVRYMPFDFAVSLLAMLEKRGLTIYLLGGTPKILSLTETNIRHTFPLLRVVGRFPCPVKKRTEEALTQVIRKSAPSLLLIGEGVKGRERWAAKNSHRLNAGLRLWCSDLYAVFAKIRTRPTRAVFERGLEWAGFFFYKPTRFFRIFLYIGYLFLLAYNKLKGRMIKEREKKAVISGQ